MIDLPAVVSLAAVASQGSVHGAATALGYTPSAISQQVKRLERSLGVRLLDRVGRGVVLTAAGQRLVAASGDLQRQVEELEAELHHSAGSVTGTVRLAAFSTAARGLAPRALRALREQHPGLVVTLEEHEPWDAVELVADGGLDVGLVHSWGDLPLSVPAHLVATDLLRDEAQVLVHRDHPLATRDQVTPHDLVGVAWVTTTQGSICRQWLSRMYVGTGSSPQIAYVSAEYATHVAFVEAGLAVALVPRLGRAPLPADVVALPVRDPVPERTITALHRRSMRSSPAVQAVLGALRGTPPPVDP